MSNRAFSDFFFDQKEPQLQKLQLVHKNGEEISESVAEICEAALKASSQSLCSSIDQQEVLQGFSYLIVDDELPFSIDYLLDSNLDEDVNVFSKQLLWQLYQDKCKHTPNFSLGNIDADDLFQASTIFMRHVLLRVIASYSNMPSYFVELEKLRQNPLEFLSSLERLQDDESYFYDCEERLGETFDFLSLYLKNDVPFDDHQAFNTLINRLLGDINDPQSDDVDKVGALEEQVCSDFIIALMCYELVLDFIAMGADRDDEIDTPWSWFVAHAFLVTFWSPLLHDLDLPSVLEFENVEDAKEDIKAAYEFMLKDENNLERLVDDCDVFLENQYCFSADESLPYDEVVYSGFEQLCRSHSQVLMNFLPQAMPNGEIEDGELENDDELQWLYVENDIFNQDLRAHIISIIYNLGIHMVEDERLDESEALIEQIICHMVEE